MHRLIIVNMFYDFSPGMKEGVYHVRVIVDGVPIPDENMCQPEGPYSDKCLFEVYT